MTVKDLEVLYDYGYWANGKLFEVISRLTPEEFTRQVVGSYGSIRNTLVHILSAEAGWLDRCGGPKRGPKLEADAFPTLASLVQAWQRVEAQMREFLGSLKDADLTRTVEFTMGGPAARSMPLGEMLQHGASHAVHHRGQVTLLLRVLGHVPGNVDLLFYFAGRREAAVS